MLLGHVALRKSTVLASRVPCFTVVPNFFLTTVWALLRQRAFLCIDDASKDGARGRVIAVTCFVRFGYLLRLTSLHALS